ncbi:MAG: cob(I)yrinic acid a,c-diamide adenosyltransferase [Aureispira sp.]|nr:cob(I)yrinic acid a,c-diamide adenosyltransferase [Aureispira sp.]
MAFKIYTKTGDKGLTSLWGGARVPKHHIRIEAYGTTDELNSYIGVVRDGIEEEAMRNELKNIQDRLFTLGSILATDPNKEMATPDLHLSDVEDLEQSIDSMEKTLPALKNFILPGGHPTVSFCHVARCICRRAERLAVALNEESPVNEVVLKYLNRLSDYLFVLSRKIAQDLGAEEVIWNSRK